MKHFRQTWVEVNLEAIHRNVTRFKQWLPQHTEIMAVVKADGYGHGAVPVARKALASGATWLGVALLEEALELRQAGIQAPILHFGYLAPEDIPCAQESRVSVTITDLDHFREILGQINRHLPPLAFHIKVDTGMGRLGLREKRELEEIIRLYKQHKLSDQADLLHWEGMYTHLATADEQDTDYLNLQLATFEQYKALVYQAGLSLPYLHVANSAGIIRKKLLPRFNLVRLGISMYGLYPSPVLKKELPFELEEAFSLHTRLTLVKKVAPGSGISYGKTYETKEEEWIGTIPIGYADGLSRSLSNRGQVLIKGKRMLIVGRICMDQCMISLDQAYPRQELVTLIGSQGEENISIDEVASLLETINYEVPCLIGKRVPRRYKQNEGSSSSAN